MRSDQRQDVVKRILAEFVMAKFDFIRNNRIMSVETIPTVVRLKDAPSQWSLTAWNSGILFAGCYDVGFLYPVSFWSVTVRC